MGCTLVTFIALRGPSQGLAGEFQVSGWGGGKSQIYRMDWTVSCRSEPPVPSAVSSGQLLLPQDQGSGRQQVKPRASKGPEAARHPEAGRLQWVCTPSSLLK